VTNGDNNDKNATDEQIDEKSFNQNRNNSNNKAKLSKITKILPNSCKNIKVSILKNFIRHIKRDSSEILLAICSINVNISIK
jgi:hypothetical protein